MEDKIYKILRNKLTADQAQFVSGRVAEIITDSRIVRKESPIEVMYDLIVEAESATKVVKARTIDPAALEITDLLAEHVLALYPHYRRTYSRDRWAKDIQAMHKSDEVEYSLIEGVIRWLFTVYQPYGEFDWREQVRSGQNLRKHFLKLYDAAKKDFQATQITEIV